MDIMLDAVAAMPLKAHDSDAGYDLFALNDCFIGIHSSLIIDTGVHIAIPYGYFGIVTGRSGLNFKSGIICPQGTIDSGYTGSIKVKLYNMTNKQMNIHKGDRIAQIIFMSHCLAEFRVVETLEDTERGSNGFGSSGI